MSKKYWLVKSEPSSYSWEEFLEEKKAMWDGVRNYQARNHLRQMKKNDHVLFYHSNQTIPCIMGECRVSKEFYPDPTAEKGDTRWSVVDLVPVVAFKTPVTLPIIKQHPELENIALIRQSRLSVMPLTKFEYSILTQLGR